MRPTWYEPGDWWRMPLLAAILLVMRVWDWVSPLPPRDDHGG